MSAPARTTLQARALRARSSPAADARAAALELDRAGSATPRRPRRRPPRRRRAPSRACAGRRGTRPTPRPPRRWSSGSLDAARARSRARRRTRPRRRTPPPPRRPRAATTVRRRSGASDERRGRAASVSAASTTARTRTRSREPREVAGRGCRRSRVTSSPRSLPRAGARGSGRASRAPPPTTVPTSASVSVTVSWSRWNTARCASRTARRNRLANAPPPTTPETAETISGRAATGRLVAQHELVGDPVADQRCDGGVAQRGRSRGRRTGRSRTAARARSRRACATSSSTMPGRRVPSLPAYGDGSDPWGGGTLLRCWASRWHSWPRSHLSRWASPPRPGTRLPVRALARHRRPAPGRKRG